MTGRVVRSVRGGRSLLLLAHPGHELLIHTWLGRVAPRVFVLTDGSGREGVPRLERTTAVLAQAGATAGPLFGRYSDATIYDWILDADAGVFVNLAHELAKEMSAEDVVEVIGDAAEGYNPIHDVFRLTLNAAVELARRAGRAELASYDFPLFERPGPRAGAEREAIRIPLDEADAEAKRAAASGYSELAREMEWSVERYGEAAFMVEWLRPVPQAAGEYPLEERPPIYERYGEFLKQQGQLERVIRYEHLLPIARALGNAARGG